MDIHELAAGKLAALFACSLILSSGLLAIDRLRTAFVVYGTMSRRDWRAVSLDDVSFDPAEPSAHLLPALRRGALHDVQPGSCGERIIEEYRTSLGALLPFSDAETRFLDLLLDRGEVSPDLLTTHTGLQERIGAQPLPGWKALNVRCHRSLT